MHRRKVRIEQQIGTVLMMHISRYHVVRNMTYTLIAKLLQIYQL